MRTSSYLRLTAYYALLVVGVWALVRQFPAIPALLDRFRASTISGGMGRAGALLEEAAVRGPLSQGEWALVTLLSLLTALALVIPVAWVYMLTKQRGGYDQSVVQTVIILPMVVAGTVILVQDSLALAFALAAIVAAVRFRNTLKDTKDAVYIFLALAVGVAAGVFAPTVAAVMSVVFNVVVLLLWRFNIGNIYADQLRRTPSLRSAEALLGPRRTFPEIAVGDPALLAALAPDQLEEVADRAARLQAYISARAADKKKMRFTGMLLVHTTQVEAAQRAVETILEAQTQRWKLAEILPAEAGRSTLEYLLRLHDDSLAATLLNALKAQGTPPIDAAEFRSLRGLKPKEKEE